MKAHLIVASCIVIAGIANAWCQTPQPPAKEPPAAEVMNAPGPEATALAKDAGTWDVVATFWPERGADPIVTKNLMAERTMIGPFLQEIMHPKPGSGGQEFQRIDYLSFNRVEGRWKYVSMDTRSPVGIMPAASFGRGEKDEIDLLFDPIAFVGLGPEVEGIMLRSDLTITRDGPDQGRKRQRFILADGKGTPWTAVEYVYKRRP